MANPEHILISAVLRTGNIAPVTAAGVQSDWFHDYEKEWNWIDRYHRRHGRCPSKALFKAKFHEPLLAVDDVEWGVEALAKHHTEKSLINTMMEANDLLQEGEEPRVVLDTMHRTLVGLQAQIEGSGSEGEMVGDWKSLFQDVADRAKRSESSGMPGIPTGFPTLDSLTGGFQPGELWVVAARLGQGKTWTLTRMAAAALFTGHRVQYDALEQSRNSIAMRMHAFLSSKYGKEVFTTTDMQRGAVNLTKYRAYLKDMAGKLEGQFFVNDSSTGRVTPLTISAQIERNDPAITYVDYIGLMGAGGSANREQWQALSQLSAELKGISMKHHLPTVVAAQINRMGHGGGRKPPGAEHLSGSDAIGQDADGVVTMGRFSDHVMEMRLAKYRSGKDGVSWFCHFTPNTGRYEEISRDEAEEIREQDLEEEDFG